MAIPWPRVGSSAARADVRNVCYDYCMKLYTYPITVEREGRNYYAYSEDFPGVYGLGKTIDGAKASILEAMRIYRAESRPSRP